MQLFSVGQRPIPGYEIIEDLGGSAFYRMWKVRSPDGSLRWWKEIDMVVGNAAIETRTLGLLVQLRHPNLNTLTNFWQLNDGKTLVIETEVPLYSLEDRLAECLRTGQGIPAAEAQQYVVQAAEGLDFLNAPQHQFQGGQVAIYHRSLRPECLLLFPDPSGTGTVCRISDFGLSKPVSDEVSQHSQGLVNYDYDPPEFFEGQTAPTSDQYSLAINYYRLRTGGLPFSGSMLEQLQARLNDTPNLQLLEEPERSIVRKALARSPRDRFENSMAFARQLVSNAPPGLESAIPAASVPRGAARTAPTMPARAPVPGPHGTPAPAAAPRMPMPTVSAASSERVVAGSPGGPSLGPAGGPSLGPARLTPMGSPGGVSTRAPPRPAAEPAGVVFHRPPAGTPPPAARPVAMEAPPMQEASAASARGPATATDLHVIRRKLTNVSPPPAMHDDGESVGEGRVPMVWVLAIVVLFLAVAIYILVQT